MAFKALCALAALGCAVSPAFAQPAGETFEAVFDHQGVSGAITFQRVVDGGSETTRMQVKLSGLDARANGWHVHELPVEFRDCGSTGGHYNPPSDPNLGELTDKHGSFEGLDDVDKPYLDPSLALTGPNSIVGRSIVLHTNGTNARFVCATIRPTIARIEPHQERIAVATFTGEFHTDIKGTIMFRQFRDSKLTQVLVDMRGMDTVLHKWHVHVNAANNANDQAGICTGTGGHHDPRNVEVDGYSCDVTNPTATCYVGDLTGKHGALNLTTTAKRMMFTDMDMPLFGANGILGRSITIHGEGLIGQRWSCATIEDLQPIQMVASNFGAGLEGSIAFSQRTAAFDPTFVRMNMPAVPSSMGAWHVHVHPVPREDNSCGANSTGGHWVPFPDEVANASDVVTADQYETGDLTGRWGTFNKLADGKNKIARIFVDDHLPLVGEYGIGGRSIVVHKNDATKARLACATIRHFEPERTVVATFGALTVVVKPNEGAPEDDQLSGTLVIERAPFGDGVVIRNNLVTNAPGGSTKHKYHVHVNPVADAATVDCATTGGHLDPAGVEVDGYKCDPLSPEDCYAGDLSGKSGLLNIRQQGVTLDPHVLYFPDIEFEDLVGRGIVIHGSNATAPRIACGTAEYAPGQDAISGVVRMTQSRRGSRSSAGSIVHTRLSLAGDGTSEEHNWHVHAKAVGDDGNGGLCTATGGHYDPFLAKPDPLPAGALPYPAPQSAASDRYELGDLTGKFGRLQLSGELSRGSVQHDPMLPLEGAYSILGRSVTVHAGNLGSARIACATLTEECPIPYTLCTKHSDCTAKFGGVDENWKCYGMTKNKRKNCMTLEASCDIVACANQQVQSEYKDVPVGHCTPTVESEQAYNYASHVAIAKIPATPGGGGGGGPNKGSQGANDLPLILSLVGVGAAGAVAMVLYKRRSASGGEFSYANDNGQVTNSARQNTPVAGVMKSPSGGNTKTKTTSFSSFKDEEGDQVGSLGSSSHLSEGDTSYLSTVQSGVSMNSGTSWSSLSEASSMSSLQSSSAASQSMNSEMMPSVASSASVRENRDEIPEFLSGLL